MKALHYLAQRKRTITGIAILALVGFGEMSEEEASATVQGFIAVLAGAGLIFNRD